MKRVTRATVSIMTLAGVLTAAPLAQAATINFTGVGTGSLAGLAASVDFTVSGSNLLVTLANIATGDVSIPTQVLTAVFWSDATAALGRVSANLAVGSSVLFAPAGGAGPNVGGEWAYLSGLSGAPNGATDGISSSGLGLFGPGDRFPGSNLQGPDSPDGLQYGITSSGDNPATGNAPVTGGNALIENAVLFTLSGLPSNVSLASIGNVTFQYGTALTDPTINPSPVPVPAAVWLFGSALAGIGLLSRRRKSGHPRAPA